MRIDSIERAKAQQAVEKAVLEKMAAWTADLMRYELDHDAMPPINGWRLTEAGRNTPEYKATEKKATEAMRRWAEGGTEDE